MYQLNNKNILATLVASGEVKTRKKHARVQVQHISCISTLISFFHGCQVGKVRAFEHLFLRL